MADESPLILSVRTSLRELRAMGNSRPRTMKHQWVHPIGGVRRGKTIFSMGRAIHGESEWQATRFITAVGTTMLAIQDEPTPNCEM